MLKLKSISFHPRLVAILDLILSVVMLWVLVYWLTKTGVWWSLVIWWIVRLLLWLVLIKLMYCPIAKLRWRHLLTLSIFSLGILLFLIFIEWKVAWYFLSTLFVVLTFFSFWFLPNTKISFVSFLKPLLRWRFIMSAIGLSGIFCGVGAIMSFRISYRINIWIWIIGAVLFSTIIAGWWWLEYGIKYNKKFLVWLIVNFVLMLELLWVIFLLPTGYLINSVLLIWSWYILWLLSRFSLTKEGIKWHKQSKFLIFNFILFILFLVFVVRWV